MRGAARHNRQAGGTGATHEQIAAPDPRFPQLAGFREPRIVLDHLAPALAGRGTPQQPELLNVWYLPRKSFQVVYRVGFTGAADAALILTVRFLPPGESAAGYRWARARARNAAAIVHLPTWGAVASIFPEDHELTSLPSLLDRRGIAASLGGLLQVPLDPDQLHWSPLNYLPGRRCSIHYHLAGTSKGVVGKIQGGTHAAATHENMVRLWASPERRFRMPRPIGLDPASGVRWEWFVPGRRLADVATVITPDTLVGQVARDLVSLHAVRAPGLPARGTEQVLRHLERKALPRIGAALPGLWSDGEALYRDLVRYSTQLPPRPATTIHGDLHATNLLVDHDGLIFLDLDDVASGDPAYDLALLGGRLLLLALQRGDCITETEAAVADLPRAYAAAGGQPIPASVFAWYLAALLIDRQIRTCIRHRAPDLARLAPVLLACARATLDSGRYTPLSLGERDGAARREIDAVSNEEA